MICVAGEIHRHGGRVIAAVVSPVAPHPGLILFEGGAHLPDAIGVNPKVKALIARVDPT